MKKKIKFILKYEMITATHRDLGERQKKWMLNL